MEAIMIHNTRELLNILLSSNADCKKSINLVPSENKMTTCAQIPYLLDAINRYFFNEKCLSDFWEFRGVEQIGWLEEEIKKKLNKMLSSKYCDIRPLSGLSAMNIVLATFALNKNVYVLDEKSGGHYATYDLCSKYATSVSYIPCSEDGKIDIKKFINSLKSNRVDIIYIDQCNGLETHDINLLSKIIKKHSPNTLLHVDISHWLGLIMGEVIENPLLNGADSISSSTHKTFPGPQKGIFATNDKELFEKFEKNRFYMVSNHHFASVLSLGVSLTEFQVWGKEYARKTVSNANLLAKKLDELGFLVYKNDNKYTNTHQIWFKTEPLKINSYDLCQMIKKYNINLNYQSKVCGNYGIIRTGLNEITRSGATSKSMELLAQLIYAITLNKNSDFISELYSNFLSTFNEKIFTTDLEQEIDVLLNEFLILLLHQIGQRKGN